jgi:hypothetical protein
MGKNNDLKRKERIRKITTALSVLQPSELAWRGTDAAKSIRQTMMPSENRYPLFGIIVWNLEKLFRNTGRAGMASGPERSERAPSSDDATEHGTHP